MTTYSAPFMQKPDAGFRLADVRSIWDAIVNGNAASQAYGIAAAGSTQATATQLTAVLNQIDTGTANQGVALPSSRGTRAVPFSTCYVYNNTGATIIVYAAVPASGTADTINGVAGATGISLPNGTIATFNSAKPGVWASDVASPQSFGAVNVAGNITETTVGSGFIQKVGSNARCGTFTLNGATTVTVSNTTVATSDFIGISMNTPAGTVGALPVVRFIVGGNSFAVLGTASDTSVYNYSIIGAA